MGLWVIYQYSPGADAACTTMIPDLERFSLGQSTDDIALADRDECREVALALARQARQSLDLFTHDLDAALYDNASFVHAVTTLATSSRHSGIRILTRDTEQPVKYGNRLIELARRLTSSIEIRQCHEDYRDSSEAFLVVDIDGLLYRKHAARYEGSANFHAPNQARTLIRHFDEIWEKSPVPTELRRLNL